MTSKPGIPSDSSHTYVEWAVLAASCRFDSSSALLHKYSNSATTYLAHTQHTVHISVVLVVLGINPTRTRTHDVFEHQTVESRTQHTEEHVARPSSSRTSVSTYVSTLHRDSIQYCGSNFKSSIACSARIPLRDVSCRLSPDSESSLVGCVRMPSGPGPARGHHQSKSCHKRREEDSGGRPMPELRAPNSAISKRGALSWRP